MPGPILFNTKISQSSPAPMAGRSIVKKVAKCALLLLAFPVTLILFAFGWKKSIFRWVQGVPNKPVGVEREPTPIAKKSQMQERKPTSKPAYAIKSRRLTPIPEEPELEELESMSISEESVIEDCDPTLGLEQKNRSRTPEECWQLIENFFEEEERDPIDVPASQLEMLKRHPYFLPAIVALLDESELRNDKYPMIKAALEAYCIASDLGNPEGILTRLTEHLNAFSKQEIGKDIFFKSCIKSIFEHGLKQYNAIPCIKDFFKECSDTKFAKICMDIYLLDLSRVDKEDLFNNINLFRLHRFFDENIQSRILLTQICENIRTLDIEYKKEDSGYTVDFKSILHFLDINCDIELVNKHGKKIQNLFNEQKERLQQEQD